MSDPAQSRRPRMQRRFGLVSLFVAMTAAAIGVQQSFLPLQRDRQIVELVQKLGGEVRYRPATGLSAFARRLFTSDNPGSIDFIVLRFQSVTDEHLKQVLRCKTLRQLDVSGTEITDAGVELLAQHTQLELLGLSATAITDRSLETVSKLTRLRFLDLGKTRVSCQGLHQLKTLTQLHDLRLTGTDVDDNCLDVVSNLPQLWRLDLSQTRVTDRGLQAIKNCQSVRSLSISRAPGAKLPNVSDEGARLISEMSSLIYLHLGQQDVTDAGLKHLATLDNLKELYIAHDQPTFTADGLEQFKRATVILAP